MAVTQASLAKQTGLSKQTISYKIQRGWTPEEILAEAKERAALKKAGGRNKHDKGFTQAGVPKRDIVKKHKKRGRKPQQIETGSKVVVKTESFNGASLRKEIALANLKELEEAKQRAELIPVAQVNNFMASAIMRCRDIFSGLRDLSDRIRQEADPIAAQLMVDAEVRRGLEELERFCEKMGRQVAAGQGVGAMATRKDSSKEAA